MSDPGRTVHIRLAPRLQRKLESLHATHYAGLPIATVAKLLLADQLQKHDEALIAIVQEQIRTPADEEVAPKKVSERLNLNSRKRPRRS